MKLFAFIARSSATLLASASANAVYLAADGVGQALIFPYYTVQGDSATSFNTLISVVNTRSDAKVVRVRFREGGSGREVFGFNLYLAANDMWTGGVVPSTADAAAPARLFTADVSCTNPAVPAAGSTFELPGGDPALTREGYVEMIEMATLTGTSAANATHSSATGVPSCAGLTGPTLALETAAPTGGLMGTLTVINVNSGLDFTVNADALAQLSTRAFYRDRADPYPDFNSAEIDPVSLVMAGGKTYRMTWANGLDAVQSVLMRKTAESEVILDAATASATDWILTFPTKRLFDPANPRPPFDGVSRPAGRQMHFTARFRPRDGSEVSLMDACEFVCAPGWFPGYDLRTPWASSVLSFRPRTAALEGGAATVSLALNSRNAWSVPLPTGNASGVSSIAPEGMGAPGAMTPLTARSLKHSNGAVAEETVTLTGFPMVGFAVRTFANGRLDCGAGACQGNYGGSFAHKWTTVVRP
jgi:hypothetical protein